jgi:hypothetical protein
MKSPLPALAIRMPQEQENPEGDDNTGDQQALLVACCAQSSSTTAWYSSGKSKFWIAALISLITALAFRPWMLKTTSR